MDKCLKYLIVIMVLLIISYSALAVEVNSSTEIYSFNIDNEQANPTSVGCPETSIRFNATIAPPSFIDYVTFRIEGNEYVASDSGSHFYFDYTKPTTGTDITTTIDWDRITIHDVSDGTAVFDPDIHVDLICDACDYSIITGNCTIYDQRIIQYIGNGDENCTSYNDTETCNYCSEDIVENIITPCDGSIKEVSYTDNNKDSCCDITGLLSDCSILYSPYNETQNVSCSYLTGDFNLNCDQYPLIQDKMECLIDLNENKDFKCWSMIRYYADGYNDQNYLQVNPNKKEYTTGSLFSKEQETREYFTIVNGIGNIYYTDEDIVGDTDYVLEVRCIDDDGNEKRSEIVIHPKYEEIGKTLPARSVWVKENMSGAMMWALLGLFLLVVGVLIYYAFFER